MNRTFGHILVLTILWVIMIFLVNPGGNFPLNDDWQYAFPVMKLVEEGQLEMQGVFAPNIVLQVVWGALFCKLGGQFDYTYLRWSTLVLGWIALMLFYFTGKKLKLPPAVAFLGAICWATSPLFFNLSFSFMTDVPFFCLMLAGTLGFLCYLNSDRQIYLLLVMLISIAAFLIRQPGILLIPTLGIWMIWAKGGSKRSWFFAATCILLSVAVYIAYQEIKPWLGINENFVPVSTIYINEFLTTPIDFIVKLFKQGVKTWIYLGFFSLPLLPFLWYRIKPLLKKSTRISLVLLFCNLLLLAFLHTVDKIFPFGGNILYNWGLGPELLADTYTLQIDNTPQLPFWVMYALNLISQLSATLLCWLILKGWKSYSSVQQRYFIFLILLNLAYLPLMSIFSFFDRFLLLPIATFFFFLLPLLSEKKQPVIAYLPIAIIAIFSLFATHDYLAWNRAKAKAFDWLVENDIPYSSMDAGFEYNGLFNYKAEKTTEEGKSYWWVDDDEWIISFGPIPGYEQKHTFPFRRWLWGACQDEVWIIQRTGR